jgi:uncharacterized protein (TIGR02246 family)
MSPSETLTREGVVALYARLLDAWNTRNAQAFAALFTPNGSTVGFDGSQMDSSAAIATELGHIFADHTPATFVARVREVRSLGAEVMLLRAVAGMVPPNESAIKPERNAIQSLVIVVDGGVAKIALFQNTPAKFDGRPKLAEQLTAELTEVLRSGHVVDAALTSA